MPYVTEDTLGELDCKIDELNEAIDGLVKQIEALEVAVDKCEVERSDLRDEITRLRACLEEVLEWCQSEYDVDDVEDSYNEVRPNKPMRMGTMIEETLGRGEAWRHDF